MPSDPLEPPLGPLHRVFLAAFCFLTDDRNVSHSNEKIPSYKKIDIYNGGGDSVVNFGGWRNGEGGFRAVAGRRSTDFNSGGERRDILESH